MSSRKFTTRELRDRAPEELSELEHEFITASLRAWDSQVCWSRRAPLFRVVLPIAIVVAASPS